MITCYLLDVFMTDAFTISFLLLLLKTVYSFPPFLVNCFSSSLSRTSQHVVKGIVSRVFFLGLFYFCGSTIENCVLFSVHALLFTTCFGINSDLMLNYYFSLFFTAKMRTKIIPVVHPGKHA